MDGSRNGIRDRVHRLVLPVIAALGTVALLGGCTNGASPSPTRAGPAEAGPRRATNELQEDYQKVIKDVLPSVVQIETASGLGSGIVYDDKGHVVTNAHVVGRARDFKVTASTGSGALKAKLVATYPEQDLAVVRLDQVPAGLKTAKLGDSSKVEVGHIVLAMGSPLGLSSSVTQGIVSAVGRTVSESQEGGGTGATIANMVQTSAAINPGNSGGALVNLDSEVIGVPTLAAADPELGDTAPGIGFAIPVSTVKRIADQIIKDGRVTDSGRAALGITGRTLLDDTFTPVGVAVVETVEGGAAEEAGIRVQDVITKLGDTGITTITSLAEALAAYQPGDKVRTTYLRDGSERTAEVTLGEI
ncbi:trypsin-like peptidase domain-containing protein [Streptomyces sp. NPDC051219]|uniref:S1C family serine protease n=1 Tax=Streptomyces sp. NPDC051219 TaxID=3155283 RepID=UPI00343EC8AB